MASREFTDRKGTVWRVWDVTPEHLHPLTKEEEYMEPWAGGWLAFESATQKRRLVAPYPPRWFEYELSKLEKLCEHATVVSTRRANTPTSVKLIRVEEAAADKEQATSGRTFESPRGRVWTVRIHELLGSDNRAETVLRFTAGDIVVDLKDWPENWKELTRDEYALLVLDAEPPRQMGGAELPQRRRDDRPAD
jgi:hypothetical protein